VTKHTPLGTEAEFFKKLREGSRTKQKIVSEYFVYYNRVMARRNEKVGYADLFAGPGLYANSEGLAHRSIPVLVCEAAIREKVIREKVHLWFNEGDPENYRQLRTAIESISNVETLRYAPTIGNKIIDSGWTETLTKLSVPTLVFLDPCGYKGLSLKLVAAVLGGFGNDCIFFFNYSRVNMKLNLELMNKSIDDFFEPDRARTLRAAIKGKSPDEREKIIVDAVESAIRHAKGVPLFFKFLSDVNRTSHHLVFASKNLAAVNAMKRILNSASSTVIEGVGSGKHDPRAGKVSAPLFGGLYEVEERLLTIYGGRQIQFKVLLQEEASTRFTETNYRDALLKLEREGRIAVDPPAEKRRFQAGGERRTLPKEVHIRFKGETDHGK
jgi:three-Cys-motif partner protein